MTTSSFSFGSLEFALTRYFDVLPAETARFRARIKQLQRLEFPQGVNVGRGQKMPYKTDHLFKLILAFELIECGLTAKPATTVVEENWLRFKAGLGAAASAAPESSPVFAIINTNALSDLNGSKAAVRIDDEASRVNTDQRTGWGRVSYITLHLSNLLDRLEKRTDQTPWFGGTFIRYELREWGSNPPKLGVLSEEESWYRLGQFDGSGVVKLNGNP